MDIQALKLDIVSKILKTEKSSVLLKINKILSTQETADWWDELPLEVQNSVLQGIHDIESDNIFTHDDVIREVRQKYGI